MFLDEIPKGLLEELRLKRAIASPSHAWNLRDNDFDDGPVIVLDDLGERTKKPSSGGFLRSIDEL